MGTRKQLIQLNFYIKMDYQNKPQTEVTLMELPTHLRDNILINDVRDTFNSCVNTLVKKNADYSGRDADPFKNFRNSLAVGVPIDRAILVRMMDKMSRVSSLLDQDTSLVDEAVTDTLDDLINYAGILKSVVKRKIK